MRITRNLIHKLTVFKVIKKTGKPFVMKWWGMDHIFLPPKYLPDLQRANFHSLSFSQTIDDVSVNRRLPCIFL